MTQHTSERHPDLLGDPSKDRILEHQYDGIQEYDNPTPGWWHWLFWASIFFSVIYAMFWHFSELSWTQHQALEQAVAKHYEQVFASVGELPPDEKTILMLMHSDDPDIQNLQLVAKGTFASKCAACHGATASGGTGPNLTDDTYINIKKLADIPDVIANGAKAGAMPAWKGRLTDNEITLMASYVASLRGTNVPGKGAEGDAIPAWPEYTPEAK